MPGRKRTGGKTGGTTIVVNPNGGVASNEPDDVQSATAEPDEVEETLMMLPEGTVAKLYKLEDSGQRSYITETTPTAMTEQRVARYGPGQYLVKMWGPLGDGTNKKGYKGQRRVQIGEGAALDAATKEPAQVVMAPPAQTASLMDAAIVSFLNMMQVQQREHSAAMMAMLARINEPKPAPTMDPLLAILLPKLLDKQTDPIEQATRIAEIGAKGSARNGITEVAAWLELADKLRPAPAGGDDPAWMRLLEKATPHLLKQAEAKDAEHRENGPAPTPNETGDAPQMMPVHLQLIADVIPDLIRGAQRGKDAALMAEWIATEIPAGYYSSVLPIISAPEFMVQLAQAYPGLAPFGPWLAEVRVQLMQELSPDSPNEGDDDDARDTSTGATDRPKSTRAGRTTEP